MQLLRFFGGRKAEQVRVFLNVQCGNDLVLGINAGVGGGGAVEVFDTEDGHLKQQIDRYKRADGQYCQYRQYTQ